MIRAPPLDADVEFVAGRRVGRQRHAPVVDVLLVSYPDVAERARRDLENHKSALSTQQVNAVKALRVLLGVGGGGQVRTYKGVAGQEGGALQHVEAGGAVAGGAVELTAAALADVAGGVGHLPAVDEHRRVLATPQRHAAGQGQVVPSVAVAEPWRGRQQRKKGLRRDEGAAEPEPGAAAVPQRPAVGSLLLEPSVSTTIIPVLWNHCSWRPAGLLTRYMLPVS